MFVKSQLLVVVALSLSVVIVQALPASVSFMSLEDPSRPVIRARSNGSLENDLVYENGQLLSNSRILLKSKQNPGFDYSSQTVRGVNIGGWLVAEPWITPSLFDRTGDDRVIDEWTYGQYVPNAVEKLQRHWNSWITESDFAQIAGAGLNHVRIPIGYWAFDTSQGEPYVQANQFDLLTQAVYWARNHNLKVIVDLHGAPGSQNGFDNSGRKGNANWHNDPNNAARAKQAIQQMASRFSADKFAGTVTMIELLNEPAGFYGNQILEYTKQYYIDGYYATRKRNPNVAIAISDAFQEWYYWQGLMQPPQYQQVLLDRHIYSVFSPKENAYSREQRLGFVCDQKSPLQQSNDNLITFVGEWTTAPTDCAKYLNGRGVGARYDGSYGQDSYYIGSCDDKTGTGENFSSSYKNFLKQMFDTQTKVYEKAAGWVYWTWKTEEAADWDYKRGLAGGWITYNLDDKSSAAC